MKAEDHRLMTAQTLSDKRLRRERVPSYFFMNIGPGKYGSFVLDNPNEVIKPPMTTLSPNPDRQDNRGFKDAYPVKPRFIFGKNNKSSPRDLEGYSGHWIVSDRFKDVMERVDPEGFDFAECDIRLPDGQPGPRYWLCDVLRVLDAVDEPKSKFQFFHGQTNPKLYAFNSPYNIHFRKEIVGSAHSFRIKYAIFRVVVDDVIKSACKAAELKGITFTSLTNG